MSDEKLYHYKCLNPKCDKECDSEIFYKYGWICSKCRSQKFKLSVFCHDCGKPIKVAFTTYLTKCLDETWRCEECNKKYASYVAKKFYASETPEDKKKRAEFHYNRWMKKSSEERKEHMQAAHNALMQKYENETPEEKESRRQFLIDIAKLGWSGLTEEEKKLKLKPLRDGGSKYYSTRSEEQRVDHNNKLAISNKKAWEKMSDDEIIKRLTPAWDAWRKWYNSLSESELEAHNKFLEIISNDYYNNETEEQKRKRGKHIFDGSVKTEYQRALQSTEKLNYMVNDKDLNETEIQFRHLLIDNDIPYNLLYCNTSIYPDFNILFPYNPYTKYNHVSPFHEWDFILYLNGTNIFVDIDGSHHDLRKMDYYVFSKSLGIEINMAQKQYFYDMQRPYQTDGLDAYIVKCHDDDIYKDDVRVENIKTKEEMTLQEFMIFIKNIIFQNYYKILKGEL